MPVEFLQDNVTALRAAVNGHVMEHGVPPDFIVLSADVARAIFDEVKANPNKYGGVVKIGGDLQPMRMFDVEVAQAQGHGRVELVCDLAVAKARRSLGRA